MMELPESVVLALAQAAVANGEDGEECAAYRCLQEAAEIKARGNLYRFMLTENGELCVQEGIPMPSKEEH